MTRTLTVVAVAVAMALGCQNGEGERAGAHAGAAMEHAGNGTVDAVRSAGHGVAYGVRELGQTMSGTQGNPQAESLSQAERARMDREAHSADQQFNQAGRQVTGQAPVQVNDPGTGSVRGGGPTDTH